MLNIDYFRIVAYLSIATIGLRHHPDDVGSAEGGNPETSFLSSR